MFTKLDQDSIGNNRQQHIIGCLFFGKLNLTLKTPAAVLYQSVGGAGKIVGVELTGLSLGFPREQFQKALNHF